MVVGRVAPALQVHTERSHLLHAGEPGPGRQQVVGAHRCGGLVALTEEEHAEEDQDDARAQGPDAQPAAGEAGNALTGCVPIRTRLEKSSRLPDPADVRVFGVRAWHSRESGYG
jgi:hypothetical protein